jgi:hypothetical protein
MLMEQTLHTLKALRLPGMATAFEEQQHQRRHGRVCHSMSASACWSIASTPGERTAA